MCSEHQQNSTVNFIKIWTIWMLNYFIFLLASDIPVATIPNILIEMKISPICKLFNWVCKPRVCIIPHGKPSCHISVHGFHVTISQSDHLNRLLNIECRFDSTTSLLKLYSILYLSVFFPHVRWKLNSSNSKYMTIDEILNMLNAPIILHWPFHLVMIHILISS